MKTKGWKEVFAFTFTQQVKTKSFIIGTIIISLLVALMAFMADFLPAVLLADKLDEANSSDAGADSFIKISDVYINNNTDVDIGISELSQVIGANVYEIASGDVEAKINEIKDSSDKIVVSKISKDEKGFTIDSVYSGGENGVSSSDCNMLNNVLSSQLKAKFLLSKGMTVEDIAAATADIMTTAAKAGEEPESMIVTMVKSFVPMISSIVLFIFIFSYSQLVAQAIAIEKSSRIVEYLLTSIKPLALIVGKVLAMCCVSLLQFLIIIASGAAGFVASLPFGIFTKAGAMTEAAKASAAGAEVTGVLDDRQKAFSTVNPSIIIVMIVTFILGFLLFSGLAGLAGSSVSKMEDLAPAMQPISIIGVLGFYLAYFPQVTGEENTLSVLARYIPISSPFVLPSDYMLGKISFIETIIAILVLAVFDVLVVMLVAKVYEHIILHTGNRLKIGDMLKMSK